VDTHQVHRHTLNPWTRPATPQSTINCLICSTGTSNPVRRGWRAGAGGKKWPSPSGGKADTTTLKQTRARKKHAMPAAPEATPRGSLTAHEVRRRQKLTRYRPREPAPARRVIRGCGGAHEHMGGRARGCPAAWWGPVRCGGFPLPIAA
jgi:hypothetical protein